MPIRPPPIPFLELFDAHLNRADIVGWTHPCRNIICTHVINEKKLRGNIFEEFLRRLNLINLGEVALSWKQIWGVLFLVINWFPLWLYYRTASGDPAHCYHIYPFLVVNGLNAQVHSCAWSLFFYLVPSRILFNFKKDFSHDQSSSEKSWVFIWLLRT